MFYPISNRKLCFDRRSGHFSGRLASPVSHTRARLLGVLRRFPRSVIEVHQTMAVIEAQNGEQYAILYPPQLPMILTLAKQHTQGDTGQQPVS